MEGVLYRAMELVQPTTGDGGDERQRIMQELRGIIEESDVLLVNANERPRTDSGERRVGTLDERKAEFIRYVQDNIQNIKIRGNILRFKHAGYKYWFDMFSVSILLLSALLTFMEAMRAASTSASRRWTAPNRSSWVSPIVISSAVTVCAALVKFKKYQVKMENLQRAIQKAIFTTFRLMRVQENAKHMHTDEELDTLIQSYSGETYDMYVQCQEEMEKNLRYEDLVTHMKTYYALSLDYERSEMEYRHRRLVMDATQELRKDDVGLEAGARLRHDRDRIQRRMGGAVLSDLRQTVLLLFRASVTEAPVRAPSSPHRLDRPQII